MKNLAVFLSITALALIFGYIIFNELRVRPRVAGVISDEGVADPEIVFEDAGLPAVSYDLPAEVSFAGEKAPLEIADVRERLDKELQTNIYLHSNTIFLIKRASRWLPQIEEILKANDIPEDFKYLPLIESNLLNVTSPKEAVGYWQILKTSGKEFGLEITDEVDERFDPLKATKAACRYLKEAYARFGDWTLVLASYNRGMGGMQRAIEDQQVDSYYDLYLNDETSRYVFRLLAIKEIITNPERYGFRINPKHLYQEEKLRYVEVEQNVKSLVAFAKEHDTNYKLIKRHNPWLRDDKLSVKKGKKYRIAIPETK
jgi:membrane-bound lytic murein transglycosylase D